MTDDKQMYNLSRRKILGSLGAVGLASAGAGLGTSAYFNDTESFNGNTLTAGELDLKVDWQQSYYGATETIVPVNAYPDHDGDGLQSINESTEYVLDNADGENVPIELTCNDLESGNLLPEDVFESPNRTDANGGPINQQDSLVALSDVKPGDWGEITFSLHLCDNPGYVWLTADNYSQSGGALTEPERLSMNETDPSSVVESDDTGDLADNTYVELWYDDDCDNIRDTQGEESNPLCVELVLDASGSMANNNKNQNTIDGAQELADRILNSNPDSKVGVTYFSADGYDQGAQNQLSVASPGSSDLTTVQDTIGDLPADGGATAIGQGIVEGNEDLLNCPEGHDRVMIVLSNGGETVDTVSEVEGYADDAEADGIRVMTIGIGNANTTVLNSIASEPTSENLYTGTDPEDIETVFNSISDVILAGETLILGEGDGVHNSPVSLAEAMAIMDSNDGRIPLDGTGDMGYSDGPTSENRDCFPANTQKCIGMKWWVPTTVENEIQGDSVSFDLGFYTEQCRHNDGAGASTSA